MFTKYTTEKRAHLLAIAALVSSAYVGQAGATAVHETWGLTDPDVENYQGYKLGNQQDYTVDSAFHNTYDYGGTTGVKRYSYAGSEGNGLTVSGWYANPGDDWEQAEADELIHWGSGLGIYRDWKKNGNLKFEDCPSSNNYVDCQHTTDNKGKDEFIALEFEKAVSLKEFAFGFVNNDWDATLFYLDKDSTDKNSHDNAANSIGGSSYTTTSFTNSGFKVAVHLDEDDFSNQNGEKVADVSAFTGGVKAKVWAIGAYLSNIGSLGTNLVNHSGKTGWDGFKLASVTVKHPMKPKDPPGEVPAPATIALFIAGLIFLRRPKVQPVQQTLPA